MRLREKQMDERKSRILDAAERLIRETGGTDFSVRALAAESEVSPATPFNLFGSKEGLLYALLLRSLDEIITDGLIFKSKDPSYHAIEAAVNAVDAFAKDPGFLRPLYQVLLGVSHPVHRPMFMHRTFAYWQAAALTIPDSKKLSDPVVLKVVSQALMAHFIGLLEMWVQRDFTDDEFRAHAVCGVVLNVLAVVDTKNVPVMLGYFDKASVRLNVSKRT